MTEVRARRAERSGSIFPRRRRPTPLVRRIVLLVLLGTCLALATVSYTSDNTAFTGPQRVALRAVAPIETGLTRVWQPVEDSWAWSNRLFHATNENPRLKQRVDELEQQLVITRDTQAENDRLREVLALKERGRFPDGYRQVVGSVIGRSSTEVDRSIVINLGSDDGIHVNDPVMVTRGLVGRVEAVSSNAARVGLVINQSQAVSASVVSSGATGVVRTASTEGSPVMELQYVSPRMRVSAGDLVVTSGWTTGSLTSIFPHGIPIGVVSSVGSSPADLYSTIQVTPFADFDRINEVIVLVPKSTTRTSYDEPVTPASDLNAPTVTPPPTRAQKRAAKAKAAARAKAQATAAKQTTAGASTG